MKSIICNRRNGQVTSFSPCNFVLGFRLSTNGLTAKRFKRSLLFTVLYSVNSLQVYRINLVVEILCNTTVCKLYQPRFAPIIRTEKDTAPHGDFPDQIHALTPPNIFSKFRPKIPFFRLFCTFRVLYLVIFALHIAFPYCLWTLSDR